MMFAQIAKLNFAADNGVDSRADGGSRQASDKPMRYLETIAEQFALLAPDDRALEMEEFEAGLKDLRDMATRNRSRWCAPGATATSKRWTS